MTQTNSQTRSIILGSAMLIVAALAIVIMPLSALAATYAYVDVAGTVRSVTADNWQTAIASAPNIAPTSGVMLLTSANDMIIGDTI